MWVLVWLSLSVIPAVGGAGLIIRTAGDRLDALETLLQQQASAIQTLQAEVASLNRWKADVAASKRNATAVAFTVQYNVDDLNNGLAVQTNPIMNFNDVITNIGNAYDWQTGKFTAPVPGVYAFYLKQTGTPNHGAVSLGVFKPSLSKFLGLIYSPGNQTVNDEGSSTQVTTHLAQGEQVWVQTYFGDHVRGMFHTVFTGYLLHAD